MVAVANSVAVPLNEKVGAGLAESHSVEEGLPVPLDVGLAESVGEGVTVGVAVELKVAVAEAVGTPEAALVAVVANEVDAVALAHVVAGSDAVVEPLPVAVDETAPLTVAEEVPEGEEVPVEELELKKEALLVAEVVSVPGPVPLAPEVTMRMRLLYVSATMTLPLLSTATP